MEMQAIRTWTAKANQGMQLHTFRNFRLPRVARIVKHRQEFLVPRRSLYRRFDYTDGFEPNSRCELQDAVESLAPERLVPNDSAFADFALADFELRLDKRDYVSGGGNHAQNCRQNQPERDKARIYHDQIGAIRQGRHLLITKNGADEHPPAAAWGD